ncbi:MAG: phosphoribosylaminoimidazolesuccinocarboxamide synthase [Cardiobacteriaceae bacterium]|nr:phosphoribosylaminoimidazolesuccinocarboxamide synthase [Cardiobacteriaceae bacterium]
MEKKALLYSGKAKSVYATEESQKVIIYYNDDATAFNGEKHAIIDGKGILNNKISTLIFSVLRGAGVPTHYVETLNEREQLCEQVSIIPLEVIVRNTIAGSMAKRLGLPEGKELDYPVFEICYKNDSLGDPLINDDHAVALGVVTYEELDHIYELTDQINYIVSGLFADCGIQLVDFKIEFGKNAEGEIVLADEISPDCCRLWDMESGEKLDKDRFRRDLGNIIASYEEVLDRLEQVILQEGEDE